MNAYRFSTAVPQQRAATLGVTRRRCWDRGWRRRCRVQSWRRRCCWWRSRFNLREGRGQGRVPRLLRWVLRRCEVRRAAKKAATGLKNPNWRRLGAPGTRHGEDDEADHEPHRPEAVTVADTRFGPPDITCRFSPPGSEDHGRSTFLTGQTGRTGQHTLRDLCLPVFQ